MRTNVLATRRKSNKFAARLSQQQFGRCFAPVSRALIKLAAPSAPGLTVSRRASGNSMHRHRRFFVRCLPAVCAAPGGRPGIRQCREDGGGGPPQLHADACYIPRRDFFHPRCQCPENIATTRIAKKICDARLPLLKARTLERQSLGDAQRRGSRVAHPKIGDCRDKICVTRIPSNLDANPYSSLRSGEGCPSIEIPRRPILFIRNPFVRRICHGISDSIDATVIRLFRSPDGGHCS